MPLFLLDATPLDTDLVSDYPALVKLGDHLFEEIASHAKITNKYRGKEALKLVLINLYKGFRRGRAVRSPMATSKWGMNSLSMSKERR